MFVQDLSTEVDTRSVNLTANHRLPIQRSSDSLLTDIKQPSSVSIHLYLPTSLLNANQLECGPMPNVMVALPNIGGALCSTPQSLADAHY